MEKFYNIYKSGTKRVNYIQSGTTHIYVVNFVVIVGIHEGFVSICDVMNMQEYITTTASKKEDKKIKKYAVDIVEQYDIMSLTYDEFIQLHFQLSLIKD